MSGRYRLLFADTATSTVLGELPFTGANLTVEKNAAGSLNATIPLRATTRALARPRNPAEADADLGPLGLWLLDEAIGSEMRDSSGNGRDGTLVGFGSQRSNDGPTKAVHRSTIFGQTGQYAELTEAASEPFVFAERAPFTVACWVRFPATPAANFRRILSCEQVANDTGWWLVWHSTLGLRFYRTVGGLFIDASFGVPVVNGSWYHVVATYDGTTVRLFVNGVQGTGTGTTTMAMPAGPAKLMVNANPAGVCCGSQIAAVSVWDRALTAGEVTAMHQRHQTGESVPSAPLTAPALITPENVAPMRTKLYLERDGVILGSGFLKAAEPDPAAGTLQLSGPGLLGYYDHRTIRNDITMTGIEQTSAVTTLIEAYANTFPAGDIGVRVASISTGVYRDRFYPGAERKPIAEAIVQLAEVRDGFLFYFDSVWTPSGIDDVVNFHYPASGRPTELVIEQGVNCADLRVTYDGSAVANVVDALGAGTGSTQLQRTVTNLPMIGPYPYLEATVTYSDVTEVGTLQAHAERRLDRGAGPIRMATAVMDPEQFTPGSFRVGDIVRVVADDGWLQVDDDFVIVGWSISVDGATESLTVQLAGADVFREA